MRFGDLSVKFSIIDNSVPDGGEIGNRFSLLRLLGKGGWGKYGWLRMSSWMKRLRSSGCLLRSGWMPWRICREEVQKNRVLSHPNIVRLHDLVHVGNLVISLEFVDGDLTAIMSTKTSGCFDWSEIKDWIVQLASH